MDGVVDSIFVPWPVQAHSAEISIFMLEHSTSSQKLRHVDLKLVCEFQQSDQNIRSRKINAAIVETSAAAVSSPSSTIIVVESSPSSEKNHLEVVRSWPYH